MSYRDTRSLCELLRLLGFPRKISLENFRVPNFELVSEILYWLVHRYDPNSNISDNIDEERDRIQFISSVTQLFNTRAKLKINPQKLYQANQNAVQEILKIASMLFNALKTSNTNVDEESTSLMEANLSGKSNSLKQAKQLATEITESGAKLFDLLSKEKNLKESRQKAIDFLESISKNLDSNKENEYIEKCLRNIISSQTESMISMEKMVENLTADEQTLDQKIKRKSHELERAEKRLKSIENVRPAFMDELEILETELDKFYSIYVLKFRNLDFLEHELDIYNQKEQEKKEESENALEILRNKIKEEELRQMRGLEGINEAEVDNEVMNGVDDMKEQIPGEKKRNKSKVNKKGDKENSTKKRKIEDNENEGEMDDEDENQNNIVNQEAFKRMKENSGGNIDDQDDVEELSGGEGMHDNGSENDF